MAIYRGIEFKTYVNKDEDTGEIRSQFTLTEHKGYEVLDHAARYVTPQGEDTPAIFETEQEAKEAAVQVATLAIDRLLN